MTIKLESVRIDAYDDEMQQHLFTVECFDDHVATVTLFQTAHNVASWEEISASITESLRRLELK